MPQVFQSPILRDLADNIRRDHSMPIGKAKRLLDGLYDADAALIFRQRVREEEAARANTPSSPDDVEELRKALADTRKQLDTCRKDNAAMKKGKA